MEYSWFEFRVFLLDWLPNPFALLFTHSWEGGVVIHAFHESISPKGKYKQPCPGFELRQLIPFTMMKTFMLITPFFISCIRFGNNTYCHKKGIRWTKFKYWRSFDKTTNLGKGKTFNLKWEAMGPTTPHHENLLATKITALSQLFGLVSFFNSISIYMGYLSKHASNIAWDHIDWF